jgi:hypothetical protein
MKNKEPLRYKSISHGICEECYERVVNEIKRLKEEEEKRKIIGVTSGWFSALVEK